MGITVNEWHVELNDNSYIMLYQLPIMAIAFMH